MMRYSRRTQEEKMQPYDDRTLRALFINQSELSPGLVWCNAIYEICNGLVDHEVLSGQADLHGHPDALITDLVAYSVFGQKLCFILRANDGGAQSVALDEMFGLLHAFTEEVE